MTAETTPNPDSAEPDAVQIAADKKARNLAAVKAGAVCGVWLVLFAFLLLFFIVPIYGTVFAGGSLNSLLFTWQILASFFELVLIGGVIGAVALAAYGGIVGKLVTYTKNFAIALLIGLSPILVPVIYDWLNEPRSITDYEPDLLLLGFFSVSPAVAAFVTMRSWPNPPRLMNSTSCPWAFPLLLLISFFILESRAYSERMKIRNAGGDIRLSKLENPRGVHEVSFNGKDFTDADLNGLIPTLSRHPRLSLDLSHTKVTDAAVASLTQLPNLTRVYVVSTEITDSQIEQLREAMPHLDIRKTWHGPLSDSTEAEQVTTEMNE